MKSQQQYNQKLELQVPLLMKVQKKRKKKKKEDQKKKTPEEEARDLADDFASASDSGKTPHPLAKTCTRNSSVEASKAPSTKKVI